MPSLSWKLGGALLLIVIVSVGLMAYITNRSTTQEFRHYITQGSMMYTQDMERMLSELYAQSGGWMNTQGLLDNMPQSSKGRLVVIDSSGVVVGDTADQWLGLEASELGLNGGTPIITAGEEVGKLYLLAAGGMMGQGRMMGRMGPDSMPMLDVAEQNFLSRVNRSLWIAGVIATAVALIVGLILTRQITRPIHALNQGANHIAKGKLNHRVTVNSKDEFGTLAQSFNTMADSLDKGEQARQRLTADITHELRTPLTVIEGTVDGIIDGVFLPDQEHLNSIKEQATLLTRLIGDLRDLSIAESGKLKLEPSPTDIVDLMRRKLSQAELSARERDVQLELKADQDIPRIDLDSTRIEQVMTNLLTNAIRYTHTGGVISVSIGMVTADSDYQIDKPSVLISVTDSGEGIAPEHLPYVFDRFYRVEPSRSRSEGGTGLGLSVVKQMVEAHRGKVWVDSQLGKGSIFYVALPIMSL